MTRGREKSTSSSTSRISDQETWRALGQLKGRELSATNKSKIQIDKNSKHDNLHTLRVIAAGLIALLASTALAQSESPEGPILFTNVNVFNDSDRRELQK